MSDKPKLGIVPEEELDEDEEEFRKLRRDIPGVKGASAIGIVAINVGKIPGKNEFFRTHPDLIVRLYMATSQQGLNATFLGVTKGMVEPMRAIGTVTNDLYLTVTPRRCGAAHPD